MIDKKFQYLTNSMFISVHFRILLPNIYLGSNNNFSFFGHLFYQEISEYMVPRIWTRNLDFQELREQLALKMALVQRLIEQQGDKYAELPDDLNKLVAELQQVWTK